MEPIAINISIAASMNTVPFYISSDPYAQYCWDELTELMSTLLPPLENVDDPAQQSAAKKHLCDVVHLIPVSCFDVPEAALSKFGLSDSYFGIFYGPLSRTDGLLYVFTQFQHVWIANFRAFRMSGEVLHVDSRFLLAALRILERNRGTALADYAIAALLAGVREHQQLMSGLNAISRLFMYPSSSCVQRRSFAHILEQLAGNKNVFSDRGALWSLLMEIIPLLYENDERTTSSAMLALARLIPLSPEVLVFLSDNCIFDRCLELLGVFHRDCHSTIQVLTALVMCPPSPPEQRVGLFERLVTLWEVCKSRILADAAFNLIVSNSSLLEVF